ncbi:MAG: GDP-mannose 4,6 dehydratase [Deltaproteobacteria bacterium]|nr:GDP-mannose 4,6 dehydratase [Deltaproteobacteria bacterium]
MSFIPVSWDDPYGAFQANTLLVAAFLEVVKNHCRSARFYQASSSEIFGAPPESPPGRRDPAQPRYSVLCKQTRRPPPRRALSTPVRHVRRMRNPLQPRVAETSGSFRDAINRPGCCGDRGRQEGETLPGRPRRTKGLEVRGRLCAEDLDDPPAGPSGRQKCRSRSWS